MKKTIKLIIVLLMVITFVFPMKVYAKTYILDGTDITITIDDTIWYVFTRDNIKDNPELDELGITYDYMNDFFIQNDTYLDAVLFLDEEGNFIELFVFKYVEDDPGIVNLSNYSNKEVQEIADGVVENINYNEYELYEKQYKFIKVESTEENDGYTYYVCQYATIVNGEFYSIAFHATSPFIDWDYEEMENIVNSIHFEIDESLKEPNSMSPILKAGIRGALVGGIGGLIGMFVKKKKDIDEIQIIE